MTQPISEETPRDDSALVAVGDRIASRLDTIDTGIGNLVQSQRRSRRWIFVLAAVSVLAVAAVVAVVAVVFQLQDTNAQLKATNRCLVVVVAANADRIGVLSPLAAARTQADRTVNKARDDLLALAVEQAPRAQLVDASKAFVSAKRADDVANDAYDLKATQNPPPPNPRDAC